MSRSTFTRKRGLPLGFAIVGLLTIVSAGMNTRINEIPPSVEFGLLQLLPLSYWLGLSLMGLGMVLALRCKSQALIAVTGTLFFAMFAGTPVLFEPNPPVWGGYTHLSTAQDIGRFARLPTAPELYSTNWPGLFLVAWFLSVVGAVAPLQMLGMFPFVTGGLTFLALFVLLRWMFPEPVAGAGSILGSLLNVWAQFHLSPQSLGLVLALLVLATVWRRRIAGRTASALLFVGLVVSHPTSTLLLLSMFILHVALTHGGLLRRTVATHISTRDDRFAHNPALSFVTVWLGWLFFQAVGSAQVAETTILARIGTILQVPEQTINIATARSVENIFIWAPLIRLASLLIYAVIGILALVLLSRTTKSRRLARFLWAALIGLVLIGVMDILLFQGLFYDRSFMLFAVLAPSICLTGIGTWKVRRQISHGILALLLVAGVAAASTTYYQETFYFVSDESVAVSEFLERAEPGSLVLDGLFPTPVWLNAEDRAPRTDLGFYTVYPSAFEEFRGGATVYAVFDPTAELWYRQWRGMEIYQFYETDRTLYSLIYANGRATIFLINSAVPEG